MYSSAHSKYKHTIGSTMRPFLGLTLVLLDDAGTMKIFLLIFLQTLLATNTCVLMTRILIQFGKGDTGWIPGSERSPEEEMATHSSILAWRLPWIEEPGRLQSLGLQNWT